MCQPWMTSANWGRNIESEKLASKKYYLLLKRKKCNELTDLFLTTRIHKLQFGFVWCFLCFYFSINCNYSNVTVLCTHSLCLFTDTDESFLAHCAVFKAMNYSKDGKAGDQDLVVQKGWCWRCLVFLENIEYLYRKNLMTC